MPIGYKLFEQEHFIRRLEIKLCEKSIGKKSKITSANLSECIFIQQQVSFIEELIY